MMKILKASLNRNPDQDYILKAAREVLLPKISNPSRRAFLGRSLSLGGVALLSGCNLTDNAQVESALQAMSRLNDRVQGLIFDPNTLAPTYPKSMITRPFPFNAFYGEDDIVQVDGQRWSLEVTGLVNKQNQLNWNLAQLRALPQIGQVTRHICVEGWSAIGSWSGVQLSEVLKRSGADLNAKYVAFQCADDYYTSIDMATALHPQTVIALDWDDDTLPPEYGYPVKVRIPTKLGYKNPKHVERLTVTNTYPGGYWEDQGYNWFGGC